MRTKTRNRGSRTVKLPVPGEPGKTYEVHSLDQADGRFGVVKRLRARMNKLLKETNADTVAKQVLCTRAMFLLSYIETQEVRSMNRKTIDWSLYLKVLRQLTDVLAKLGLDKAADSAKTLESYLASKSKKPKTKKVRE